MQSLVDRIKMKMRNSHPDRQNQDDFSSFQFQVSNHTEFWRYNEFYKTIRSDIGLSSRPRILMFGCSTGAEIQTLYHYWPECTVSACDIKEDLVKITAHAFPKAEVFLSTRERIIARAPFDLVCANSVFCRNPLPTEPLGEALPFDNFEKQIAFLVECLADNGILMAYNCNYFVQDTTCYEFLRPIAISRSWTGSFVPRFQKDGTLCARPVLYGDVIGEYIIDPDNAPGSTAHLSCALFKKENKKQDTVISINSGMQSTLSRLAIEPPLQLPPISNFMTVYKPYIHEAGSSANKSENSIVSTYVTDFINGGWRLHGITNNV